MAAQPKHPVIYGPDGAVARVVQPKPSMVAFDAAGSGRRLSSWLPPIGMSMASIVNADAQTLRDRSRDAVRRSTYAAAACNSWVANVVGTGISPSPTIEDPGQREAFLDLFNRWVDVADVEGQSDFYGLQSIIARSLFEAGEIFIRFRPRYLEDGLPVPFQLQLIEAEQVPLWKNEVLESGNIVRMGVEFDRNIPDRRVAYWTYRTHPGDYSAGGAGTELVRVPAAEMLHIFDPLRKGQVRGIPKMSVALLSLYELDQYLDAALVKQKLGQYITGFFTDNGSGDNNNPLDAQRSTDPSTPTLGFTEIQPGTFQRLPPGVSVAFAQAPEIAAQFDSFCKTYIRSNAAALDVMYEAMSNDYSDASYSSIRAGSLEIQRRLQPVQHNVLVFQCCRPVWNRLIRDAVIYGIAPVKAADYLKAPHRWQKGRWIPQPWPWVDPLKDRLAEQLAVRMMSKPLSSVIEQEGYSAHESLRQSKADFDLLDELGLVSDADPRTRTKSGVAQKAEDAALRDAGK
ncbi:phage portal protein [Azospirillum brasilense]|uniref:phage portal protein n=1 Tax=Azospirillum brasilense TaxID=192 RepID=UPI000E6A1D54|nr:phage portal protein [Azospirillum brasilense]NUB27216.1 phage portal protein [Azospirillum brasilense]NUB30544.1 phage portal protein [Azospirillum brasilense]RIW07772.1 phage portal protein [Azospirillum brasilense]